jgi:molybdopterin converting factor small subunit
MRVLIPTPLLGYTGTRYVTAEGATLGELLRDLERQYPGIRFRMVDEQDRVRPHMRIFVNGAPEKDLGRVLAQADSVNIVQALSGG